MQTVTYGLQNASWLLIANWLAKKLTFLICTLASYLDNNMAVKDNDQEKTRQGYHRVEFSGIAKVTHTEFSQSDHIDCLPI